MKLGDWPYYGAEERAAVERVLRSGRVNYWTGEDGRRFEQEFADFVGARYGIALANGTVALELALHATGVRPGDQVLVPGRTFIATASAVMMRGAVPVFADVDPNSQNLTVATLEAALTRHCRALIVVHLAGWPCDMDAILAFAQRHGLSVIEDCAQAHGASLNGSRVGSFGAAAAFSFCQDKIVTTGGEGGFLATSRQSVWRAASAFKDHGRNSVAASAPVTGPGYRQVYESLGTNWRMTGMQAAIGRVQIGKLPEWLARRRVLAARFARHFARWPVLRVPRPGPGIEHAFYRFYVFVRRRQLAPGWSRDAIVEALQARGVPCQTGGSGEIYLEKVIAGAGLAPSERLPVGRRLGATALAFPVHPTMSDAQAEQICAEVDAVMAACTA